MRPGTYLLLTAPHCMRDAENELTADKNKKKETQYLNISIQR
jgi:hypothetical protein